MPSLPSDSEVSIPSAATSYNEQLSEFDFSGLAIDVALRTLLAKVELPKETQQIDRAIEDFAKRYYECNPDLADSPDIVYGIAFSILLLHTDAHNKSVRHKMTKETFIAHTKILEGGDKISPEVLDIMYDNIVSAEFNFAARENHRGHDSNDEQASWSSWAYRLFWMDPSSTSSSSSSSSSHVSYPMTLAEDTRLRLMELMPEKNNLHYAQRNRTDITNVHMAFCHARPICLAGVRSKNTSRRPTSYITNAVRTGVLDRKQDLLSGGRRATMRGWRSVGVALTNSQLLFFNDSATCAAWGAEASSSFTEMREHQRHHLFPHFLSTSSSPAISSSPTASTTVASKPSEMSVIHRPHQAISLENAVCVYDESYTKYSHVFRLVAGDGQQFLFRARNNADMDDWLTKINYASTQKTLSVHLRPMLARHFEHLKEAAKSLRMKREVLIDSLERTLQLRRNLLALAPIQRSSKDRMIYHAEVVGKQLQNERIALERITCYRAFCEMALLSPFSERPRTEPILSSDGRNSILASTSLLRRRSLPQEAEDLGVTNELGCGDDDDDNLNGQKGRTLCVPSTEHWRSKSNAAPEHNLLRVIKMRGRSRSSASLALSICESDDISIFDNDGENIHDLIGRS